MGNSACQCCEEPGQSSQYLAQNPNPAIHKISSVKLPSLHPLVQKHVEEYRPFQKQLDKEPVIRNLGQDIFQGRLTYKGKPQGYGIVYRKDGCVFIGLFQNGLPQGPGHFVLTDGSYYHGLFENNKANDNEGFFKSQNFEYKGGVKDNSFDGQCTVIGQDYKFDGIFRNGSMFQGKLSWKNVQDSEQVVYEGYFNEKSQFEGIGILKNSKGIYEGQFKEGLKEGEGTFTFTSGIKYKGQYWKGQRHGKGVIYAKNGIISYSGQFKNNLPHGKGFITNSFGDKVWLKWIEGLDDRLLEQTK